MQRYHSLNVFSVQTVHVSTENVSKHCAHVTSANWTFRKMLPSINLRRIREAVDRLQCQEQSGFPKSARDASRSLHYDI